MARTESYNLLLAKSGLDEVIKIYQDHPKWMWKQMAPVLTTDQAFWRGLQEADFSIAPSVGQSQPLQIEDFETPYFKDYYPIKRALTAANSTESIQSDLYGVVKRTGVKLFNAVNKAFEVEAAAILNLSIDTAVVSQGPDGQPLASNAHPWQNGTTQNTVTNNPVLSQASLETARTMLIQQFSHKGDPMMFMGPFDLFVPPALISIAERAIGASTYGVAGVNTGTAKGNDPNIMDTSKVRMICNPWFTQNAYWMLRCREEDDHGQRLITRRLPTTKVWDDYATDSVRTAVTGIICRAIRDWRGCVVSRGDGGA